MTRIRRGWASVVSQRMVAASSFASGSPHGSSSIRVVTYNILANKYALGGYHSYCPLEHLKWSYRLPRIAQELIDYDMDLLMLQEVEEGSFENDFKPMMKERGYGGAFLPRNLPEVSGTPEGVALFYRTSLFRRVETHTLIFSDAPPFPLAPLPDSPQLNECIEQFFKRPEGAILALLEHLPSGRMILAASVHLFWNPRYPDVKVIQAMSLCSEISKMLKQRLGTVDVPVVIGGDFNSIASKRIPDSFDKELPIATGEKGLASGVYQLMTQGNLPTSHPDHPVRRRSLDPSVDPLSLFTSAYASGLDLHSVQAGISGNEPPLTTKTASFAGTLDYIFASCHWKVVSTLDLPYKTSEDWRDPLNEIDFRPIPSEHFPSDHLAVGGEICF